MGRYAPSGIRRLTGDAIGTAQVTVTEYHDYQDDLDELCSLGTFYKAAAHFMETFRRSGWSAELVGGTTDDGCRYTRARIWRDNVSLAQAESDWDEKRRYLDDGAFSFVPRELLVGSQAAAVGTMDPDIVDMRRRVDDFIAGSRRERRRADRVQRRLVARMRRTYGDDVVRDILGDLADH